MPVPLLCILLQDTHFLLKLFEFVLTFVGFRHFFEGTKKNLLESMIINLAVPGGLLTVCVMLFLYYLQEKNGSIEPILLTIYGILNIFSGFIYLHESIHANTCPMVWKLFEASFIKTATCLATGFTMLGESGVILYLPELQAKLSEYAYNENYDEPDYAELMSEPLPQQTMRNVPAQRTMNTLPTQRTMSNVPAEHTMNDVPAQRTMSNVPAQRTMSNVPAQRTMSNEPAQRRMSNEPAQRTMSNEPAQRRMSNEPSQRTMSNESAQRRMSNEPAQRTMSIEPAQRTMSNVSAPRVSNVSAQRTSTDEPPNNEPPSTPYSDASNEEFTEE